MYKVEYYEFTGETTEKFKRSGVYPVRVVRRGDKRVLEDEAGLIMNVGWNSTFTLSLATDFGRQYLKDNFRLKSSYYYRNYKDFKDNRKL